MRLCGGDLSFASALTYDFEVYAAAQKKWLEVSSVSNFESFQAHRLKLRYRESGEKKVIVFNFSGHGHLDLAAYEDYLDGKIKDYAYPEEKVRESLANLPKF